jgi:hydroxyacylglutathione hydrolase
VYATLPSSHFKLLLHLLIHSLGEGKSDNYAYLVIDDKSKDAVIIDPANPDECVPANLYKGIKLIWMYRVAPVLKEQINSGKINLTAIINTHQYVHIMGRICGTRADKS